MCYGVCTYTMCTCVFNLKYNYFNELHVLYMYLLEVLSGLYKVYMYLCSMKVMGGQALK